MEIDHEIAKCLDTLDRQGLKYLKETLRTSNLFSDDSPLFQTAGSKEKKPENEISRSRMDAKPTTKNSSR